MQIGVVGSTVRHGALSGHLHFAVGCVCPGLPATVGWGRIHDHLPSRGHTGQAQWRNAGRPHRTGSSSFRLQRIALLAHYAELQPRKFLRTEQPALG